MSEDLHKMLSDEMKSKRELVIYNIKTSLDTYVPQFHELMSVGNLCSNSNVVTQPLTIKSAGIEQVDIETEDNDSTDINILVHCDGFMLQYIASCLIEHVTDESEAYQYVLDAQICDEVGVLLLDTPESQPIDTIIKTREDVISLLIQVFSSLKILKDTMHFNHNHLLLNKVILTSDESSTYIDSVDLEFNDAFTCKLSDYSNSLFVITTMIDEGTEYETNRNITFYRANDDSKAQLVFIEPFDEYDETAAYSLKDLSYEEYRNVIHSDQRMASSFDYYFFIVSCFSNKLIYSLISEDADVNDFYSRLFPLDESTSLEELVSIDSDDPESVYEYLESKNALYVNISEQINDFLESFLDIETD